MLPLPFSSDVFFKWPSSILASVSHACKGNPMLGVAAACVCLVGVSGGIPGKQMASIFQHKNSFSRHRHAQSKACCLPAGSPEGPRFASHFESGWSSSSQVRIPRPLATFLPACQLLKLKEGHTVAPPSSSSHIITHMPMVGVKNA